MRWDVGTVVRETVPIYELLTSDGKLERLNLSHVDLVGPAMVFPVPGATFLCEDCAFYVPPGASIEAIIWEVARATPFVGPIELIDCTFRSCSFSRIGWVLSGFDADRFRQMVGSRSRP